MREEQRQFRDMSDNQYQRDRQKDIHYKMYYRELADNMENRNQVLMNYGKKDKGIDRLIDRNIQEQ